MPSPDLFLRVPSDSPGPAAVRLEVVECLGARGHAASAADIALVVSELVTNAIVHGSDPIELTMICSPTQIRVEVFDGSGDAARVSEHPRDSGRARGLHIIDEVTARWGASERTGGKTVWFEYDVAPI